MRKLALLTTALVAVFATAAVAIAQTDDGGYSVSGSTKPRNAEGSKRNPKPIGIQFSLQAPEGNRPATIAEFHVAFDNVQVNGRRFRKCTARSINRDGSDEDCRRGARVGTGTVHNLAGATNDPTDTSITCNLDVTLYNAGRNRVAIYLEGNPNGRPAACPIPISQALDARWVRDGRRDIALEFSVPQNLQNPLPGVSNAIQELEAEFDRRTRGKGRRRVGYLESIGCRRNERDIDVELEKADGSKIELADTTRC